VRLRLLGRAKVHWSVKRGKSRTHYRAEEIYVNEEIYVIGSCGYIVLRQIIRFNGPIPGEPGLPGFYWSKRWWKWWWQLEL